MARILIIVLFLAIVFWVYSIVDCAIQPPSRHRAVGKPTWIAIVVIFPVLGGILWFAIGRVRKATLAARRAPDDDPEFLDRIGTVSDQDERIRRLEEELAQLDAEDDDPRWNPPTPPSAEASGASGVTGVAGTSVPPPDPPALGTDRSDDDDTRGQRGAVG